MAATRRENIFNRFKNFNGLICPATKKRYASEPHKRRAICIVKTGQICSEEAVRNLYKDFSNESFEKELKSEKSFRVEHVINQAADQSSALLQLCGKIQSTTALLRDTQEEDKHKPMKEVESPAPRESWCSYFTKKLSGVWSNRYKIILAAVAVYYGAKRCSAIKQDWDTASNAVASNNADIASFKTCHTELSYIPQDRRTQSRADEIRAIRIRREEEYCKIRLHNEAAQKTRFFAMCEALDHHLPDPSSPDFNQALAMTAIQIDRDNPMMRRK